MDTVAPSAIRNLLSHRIYMHQGHLKRVRMMTAKMMREMVMCIGGEIHLNQMIENLVRQNALILTDHFSHCRGNV